MNDPWAETAETLREIADAIEKDAPPVAEVVEAAREMVRSYRDPQGFRSENRLEAAWRALKGALDVLDDPNRDVAVGRGGSGWNRRKE